MSQLSLLNFNTLGTTFFAPNIKGRYQKIAEIINEKNIDIICFQEIGTYYNLNLMKKFLKGYHYCIYTPQVSGPRGGLVIFSKLPIKQQSFYSYAALGSMKNITFYTKLLRNGILMAELQEHPLLIMNTHTVTDFEFKNSPTNKYFHLVKGQVLEAAKLMSTWSQLHSVILTGDFNMAKDKPLYKEFLKTSGAYDPFSVFKSPTYNRERLDYKFKGKISDRIDFIFLKQNAAKFDKIRPSHLFDKEVPLSSGTMSYLSDHIGLQISFSLN